MDIPGLDKKRRNGNAARLFRKNLLLYRYDSKESPAIGPIRWLRQGLFELCPREREVVRCCQVVRCKIKLMQNRPSITTVSNFNKVVEVKQYYDVFGL